MNKNLKPSLLFAVELLVMLFFCFVPLLFNNPYRINIFLSWEGAYRLYLGQIPFRDFALPMGYGYWVIPALFFKIFGPYMHSLIISQAFINVVSVLAFRSILKMLDVKPIVILLSAIVFCLSYVSWNFWPWYNHLVIVLELVAIYFALKAVFSEERKWYALHIFLSAFFVWFSIFTKQDGGALAALFVGGILLYNAIAEKKIEQLLIYIGCFFFFGAVLILPLLPYEFSYWFNYGQPPHNSRIHTIDFMNQIIGWAYWEKFFLLVMTLQIFDKIHKQQRSFFLDKKEVLQALICVGFILEALIIQVTSYEPPNGEAFFYAFGFAYCLNNLRLSFDLSTTKYALATLALVVFWWTGIYWRNIKRLVADKPVIVEKMENKAKHKYRLAKEFKTVERLFLSESTIDGMHKIKDLPVFKEKKDVKVLNMSELTSLAYEVPFTPLTNQPMWFHQNVSIFQKEVDDYCTKISNHEYDVVIFESIPYSEVVDFFPMGVKECLDKTYKHEFTFLAPRTPEHSFIDVYTMPTK